MAWLGQALAIRSRLTATGVRQKPAVLFFHISIITELANVSSLLLDSAVRKFSEQAIRLDFEAHRTGERQGPAESRIFPAILKPLSEETNKPNLPSQ
jgi:hypothetical protein